MKETKRDKKTDPEMARDEDYSVSSTRKNNVIAYIICVIAAVLLWLLIMNLNQPTNIPLSAAADDVSQLAYGVVLWKN